MRFFASWWERVPVRAAAPSVLAVIVGAGFIQLYLPDIIADILGHYWN